MDSFGSGMLTCLFLVVAWRSTLVSCNTGIACLPHERDALLSVKTDLLLGRGLPSPSLNWSGFNCCNWEGVQCNNLNSHVIEIHLPGNWEGLESTERAGTNLSPALFKLQYLEYLDLSGNGLTGVIPAGALAGDLSTTLSDSASFQRESDGEQERKEAEVKKRAMAAAKRMWMMEKPEMWVEWYQSTKQKVLLILLGIVFFHFKTAIANLVRVCAKVVCNDNERSTGVLQIYSITMAMKGAAPEPRVIYEMNLFPGLI